MVLSITVFDSVFNSCKLFNKGNFFFDAGKKLLQKHIREYILHMVVALLFYVHGKHLRSCRDGQLT